jgi:lysyl-tRNA synthetase class 2
MDYPNMKNMEQPLSADTLFGRCLGKKILSAELVEITLINLRGIYQKQITLGFDDNCNIGDIVKIENQKVQILTRAKHPSSSFTARTLDPRRQHALKIRRQVESGIREFFENQGFIETRTPTLVQSPGMEPHIRPFATRTGEYIPTSPEFSMKKLLVGGLEKIYQICPAFRVEPKTTQHHPEFTMLEWYRSYSTYEEIMMDFENLMQFLCAKILNGSEIIYQNKKINLSAPWPRMSIRDLFLQYTQIDLNQTQTLEQITKAAQQLGLKVKTSFSKNANNDENSKIHNHKNYDTQILETHTLDSWDDVFYKIWLEKIEPQLQKHGALIVHSYPASQAALAVVDSDIDGGHWARRFEPYVAGLELGNAFQELTDSVEQSQRFETDMNLREKIYGKDFPKSPIDFGFIKALEEGMPPSSGIAVGVDRLVMLFANEPDIDYTLWLPSFIKNN